MGRHIARGDGQKASESLKSEMAWPDLVRSDPEAIGQLLALADEWLKLAAVVEKKWLP